MSAVTERVALELEAHGALAARIKMTNQFPRGLRKFAGRALRLAHAVCALPALRIRGATVLYMPLDAGGGIFVNIALGLVARILGYRLFVHHHSFAYINAYSHPMAALLRVLPRSSTHVFLCNEMQARFRERYREAWDTSCSNFVIVSNGFMLEPPPASPRKRNRKAPLVLGHLSNLSREKGTETFIDLVDELIRKGAPITAVLAGPIRDARLETRIRAMAQIHSNRLRWIGPIYDQGKDDFFRSIDLFAFPTEYRNEAQPLVLVEALSHGVPIMTINRGCIACDYDELVGLIADDRHSFMRRATDFVAEALDTPTRLYQMARHAQTKARADYERSSHQLSELISCLSR